MNEATRIMAPGVLVEIRPGLKISVKFNLVSSVALEHTFGNSNPLAILLGMTAQTATDRVAFLLGAGMLHEVAAIWTLDPAETEEQLAGLVADMDGIDAGTALAELEAARIGRKVIRLFDGETMDSSPLVNAIVKAADIARPLDPCARCDHALGMHGWFEPCTITDCACEGFTRRCADCEHLLADHDAEGICKVAECKCTPKVDEGKAPAPGSPGATSTPSPQANAVAQTVSSGA